MDKEVLIREICSRVLAKVTELEQPDAAPKDGAPKLLVLTGAHGTICHDMLENKELAECYQLECALMKGDACRMDDYEAVIAYTMTNEALGKIVHGIFDTDFTKRFGEALLSGKKIYLVSEDVELYRFKETAPPKYYSALEANLELLKESGVVIAPQAQIPELILRGEAGVNVPEAEAKPEKPCAKEPEKPVKEAMLCKRIITEKDIIELGNDRVTTVLVTEKAILTDLAKEYAARHKMTIRRNVSSEKE